MENYIGKIAAEAGVSPLSASELLYEWAISGFQIEIALPKFAVKRSGDALKIAAAIANDKLSLPESLRIKPENLPQIIKNIHRTAKHPVVRSIAGPALSIIRNRLSQKKK